MSGKEKKEGREGKKEDGGSSSLVQVSQKAVRQERGYGRNSWNADWLWISQF